METILPMAKLEGVLGIVCFNYTHVLTPKFSPLTPHNILNTVFIK